MVEKTSQNWTTRISTKAGNYLNKLGKPTRDSIRAELTALAGYKNPLEHPNAKPLLGPFEGLSRLRAGGYRVVFGLLKKERIISVVNIAPRGDVYK